MKLLISESEKQRILEMHNKVRRFLFEDTVTLGGIDVDVPDGVTISDNFKAACESWKEWSPFEAGVWTPSDGNPPYAYCKYKNYQKRWQEIKSNGEAIQHDASGIYYRGTWSLDENFVELSYMKQSDIYWDIDDYLADNPNCVREINPAQLNDVEFVHDFYGQWNDYYFSRVKGTGDDSNWTIEIKSNGTWKWKDYSTDDTKMTGKWSWDGSKLEFDTKSGMSTRASGYLTNEDGPADDNGVADAILTKNKIGNIGAKGPVVKYIQWEVTPGTPDGQQPINHGTGLECGDDIDKCDGVYGQKTKELVRKWQKEKGLTADGIFGKQSATYLDNYGSEKEDLNN